MIFGCAGGKYLLEFQYGILVSGLFLFLEDIPSFRDSENKSSDYSLQLKNGKLKKGFGRIL